MSGQNYKVYGTHLKVHNNGVRLKTRTRAQGAKFSAGRQPENNICDTRYCRSHCQVSLDTGHGLYVITKTLISLNQIKCKHHCLYSYYSHSLKLFLYKTAGQCSFKSSKHLYLSNKKHCNKSEQM